MRTWAVLLLCVTLGGLAHAADPLDQVETLAGSDSPRDHRRAIQMLGRHDSKRAVSLLRRVLARTRKALRDMAGRLDAADVTLQEAWGRYDWAVENDSSDVSAYKAEWQKAKAVVRKAQTQVVAHLIAVRDGGKAFGAFRTPEAAAEVTRLAKSERDPLLRQFYVRALGARALPGDVATLLTLSQAKDLRVAATALLALRPQAARRIVHEAAKTHLQDTGAAWPLRLAAAELIARGPFEHAVQGLVALATRDDGLLGRRADDLLFGLTGWSMAGDHSRWKTWWEDHREGIEAGTFVAGRNKEDLAEGTRTVVSFFQIPIDSDNVTFVVDYSSSMNAPLKIPGEGVNALRRDLKLPETRLGWAQTETIRAIRALPDGAKCQVIVFSDAARPFAKHPVAMSAGTRKRIERWLVKQKTGWLTNLWDGVRVAFADYLEARSARFDRLPDTIVLLTDGHPTRGRVQDDEPLAFLLRSWNDPLGAVVHTVGVGDDHARDLLERFATETHGIYLDRDRGVGSLARKRRRLPVPERGPYLARDVPRLQEAWEGEDPDEMLAALEKVLPAADWLAKQRPLLEQGRASAHADLKAQCVEALRRLAVASERTDDR